MYLVGISSYLCTLLLQHMNPEDYEDVCPECGRYSIDGRICRKCINDQPTDFENE